MIFKFAFIERLYARTKALARHKHAVRALMAVAFFESFIFPVPTGILLIALVQANRERAWRLATLAAIASVCGAVIGYLIGWFAFDTIGMPVLKALGMADKMSTFQHMADEYGALAVFGAGLTPFPFKVITLLSGALKLNFMVFILASICARFGQFFLISAVVWKFGPDAEMLIRRHFAKLTTALFLLITLGWAVWHYGFAS